MNQYTIKNLGRERVRTISIQRESRHRGRGLIRIDFDEESTYGDMSPEEMHRISQARELNFLYQEENPDGGWSRVFAFVE